MSRRRSLIILAAIALAIGAFAFFYRGPGRPVIRGYVGDVGATMLVFAAVSLAWRARVMWRALATAVIALAIEASQLIAGGVRRGVAGEILLGASFDGWDLVAYALGIAVAVLWERATVGPASSARS